MSLDPYAQSCANVFVCVVCLSTPVLVLVEVKKRRVCVLPVCHA